MHVIVVRPSTKSVSAWEKTFMYILESYIGG